MLDHLNSVVGMFNGSGVWEGGYSYSPYGETRHDSTTSAVTTNPLRYISGQYEGDGLYKLGSRIYDTSTGRFTQTDPSGQEKNPYAYAACNPIGASDPTGRSCSGAIAAIVGGAFALALGIAAFIFLPGLGAFVDTAVASAATAEAAATASAAGTTALTVADTGGALGIFSGIGFGGFGIGDLGECSE